MAVGIEDPEIEYRGAARDYLFSNQRVCSVEPRSSQEARGGTCSATLAANPKGIVPSPSFWDRTCWHDLQGPAPI